MATLTIRPTSDSQKTGWTGVGSTSNLYANVDESSKNESDYNYIILSLVTKAKQSVKIGSTVYRTSSEITLTTSYALCTWTMTVKPSDSSAWTWSDVDAFIGGCVESGQTSDILYGFGNHTTEEGVINSIALNSYLKYYYDGSKFNYLYDCMTYAVITYTPGWANIAKLDGATATDLTKWDGALLTDLAKWTGATV